MPTTAQEAEFLFKQSLRVGNTRDNVPYFSEPIPSAVPVYTNQIWGDYALIPPTAPVLPPDGIDPSGTVQYKEKLALTAQPGGMSFYSPLLKNAINFNFDPAGSYNYTIYQSDGTTVVPLFDWVVDPASGILTFYSNIPPNMPPKISFYRYVGTLGVSGSGLPTDAAGVTVISDGPGGTNPVNKAEAATGDVLYLRKASGLTILNGANPPGGLSDTLPYGNVDNSPNWTISTLKVNTTGNASVPTYSYPSSAINRQSYACVIVAHGTATGGGAGNVFMLKLECTMIYPNPALFINTYLGSVQGALLEVVFNGSSYDIFITGITGLNITWIITSQYSQLRI